MTPRQARLDPAKGRKLTIGRTRRRGESAGRAGKGEATLHNGARQDGAARRKRAKPHNAGERTRWKERREQNRKKKNRHTRVTAIHIPITYKCRWHATDSNATTLSWLCNDESLHCQA